MSFRMWGYDFDGAYPDRESLESRAGVYVVWCRNGENWKVVDVGEAGDVRARLLAHDRENCWARNCSGALYFAATYTPHMQQLGRRQIEKGIRSRTNPPCGLV